MGNEVEELYDMSDWPWSVIFVAFLFYNVVSLIHSDVVMIHNPLTYNLHPGSFYFVTLIASIFHTDLSRPVEFLAILELLGLGFFFACLAKNILDIMLCCSKGKSDLRRWAAVAEMFWVTLPILSTYSAMRLLDRIVPTKFARNFGTLIGDLQEDLTTGESKSATCKALGKFLYEFLLVLLCFVVGFDSFLLKLRRVSVYVNKPASDLGTEFWDLLNIVQFAIQILGVVNVQSFVNDRLFQFVFAGEDGVLQSDEKVMVKIWNCLLARQMWRVLSPKSIVHFIIVGLTYDDYQFQKLVLNDVVRENPDP